MKMFRRLGRLLPMVLMWAVVDPLDSEAAAPPQNLELRAEYDPGGTCSDCYGWRATIGSDGTVRYEVKSTPGWGAPDVWAPPRTSTLSPREVRRLARTVEASHFLQLKESYSAEYRDSDDEARIVTDQDTVALEVTVSGAHRRVEIYGLELVADIQRDERAHKDREAGRRFCQLWAEVLSVVQSPNAWQKAGVYR